MTSTSNQGARTTGFTLVEVLVAIVILTLGLLGIAALMASVIKRNQTSIYHSIAVVMANDIAERMRTNDPTLVNLTTAASNAYVTELAAGSPSAYTKDCGVATNSCTTSEMAKYDAKTWETKVAAVLPAGMGVVCLEEASSHDTGTTGTPCSTATGNKQLVIKLLWDEGRSGGQASNSSSLQRYVVVFRP